MKSFTLTVIILAVMFCTDCAGQTRLDDAASPRARVDVTPTWLETDSDEASDDEVNTLIANVPSVEYRLNTATFLGKNARIYLALPQSVTGLKSVGGIRAEWRTRSNLFLSGSVLPGARALVFTGKVTGALTTVVFDYVISIDSRAMLRPLEFRPHFEIEITP
jgi:hypothetical protein